ncbi:hypothetical protein GCM10007938_39840 [Vibrio zhanjiangensis]|uniref:histidine kinase n=1 Tax=Vibrio zhanjiangensis TaxID=1046128 RepID=A0ABQ6F5J0_9VIBR|nr:response regulator [Vibrio zhanjiangensis]GLT20201.1 hypothetical protein GCM10007938_39840 [Vibrio zhanjiangensis]
MSRKHRYLSINKKLLFAVAIMSTVLALATASYNLHHRLQIDIQSINDNLSNIKNSHLSGITESVWVEDRLLLRAQIDGLFTLPNVDYAHISTETESIIERGEAIKDNVITQTWPLIHHFGGKNYTLGQLIIQSDLTNTYQSLWSQFLHILSAESIRIILLLTGVLTFTWFFIIRRINMMEKAVSENNPCHTPRKIGLPTPWFHDEITHLANKFNESSDLIARHYAELGLAKDEAEKEKDKAIQASKAKSSFLANMSHEIRTPLNGVIGISEVLSDTELTATQRDYVDTIETSSHLLLNLINDILDFSKIESGMLVISPHSTNVRESIYDIASIVSTKAKEKQIHLRVSISPNTPYCLMIDDHRLRQILMNFMSNAVKFTETGEVELAVNTLHIIDSQAIVEFSVRDSGIGIDEKQQRKIFEPFAQEDDSTTRQFGGTGLGLAISTQLVELMGGVIQLESKKGNGSRFFFTLSLPIAEHHVDTKHTLKHSQLCLVCDDKDRERQLKHELNVYHIPVQHSFTRLDGLPTWNTEQDNVIVIYVETVPNLARQSEHCFYHLSNTGIPVCIIKHLHSDTFNFGDSVDAIITQPLLGLRLVKILERLEQNVHTHSPQTDANIYEGSQSKKILIVDDNEVNRKIAGLHVEKAGYRFDLAENGQKAVEMFKHNHYGLILMDCMMPVMDGFEATKKIRYFEQEENKKSNIPIIALTASVADDDIQKCFDVGMDDYMPKPFKAAVLKDKLNKFLSMGIVSNLYHDPIETSGIPPQKNDFVSGRVGRVLLVEDNHVNQKVASLMLSKAGYQFEVAENGQIAVDKYKEDTSFSLILMDCMMPVMDGFEATQKIRAHEQLLGLPKTPIIALTASVIDDDIRRCYDSGMDAYLPKPLKTDTLLYQIENTI